MGKAKQTHCGCNYRAFQRIPCETSIVYAFFPSDRYFHAKMINCCSGGMYFETEHQIPKGADLLIKLTEDVLIAKELEIAEGCRGEVMWCRKVSKNGNTNPIYGIGIRFMTNICNHCGTRIPYHELTQNDDFMCLCKDCATHLTMLTEGNLKHTIENYLLGNVV